MGRLELPTNGLKGHCSAIELHAHSQVIIVARQGDSVNKNPQNSRPINLGEMDKHFDFKNFLDCQDAGLVFIMISVAVCRLTGTFDDGFTSYYLLHSPTLLINHQRCP